MKNLGGGRWGRGAARGGRGGGGGAGKRGGEGRGAANASGVSGICHVGTVATATAATANGFGAGGAGGSGGGGGGGRGGGLDGEIDLKRQSPFPTSPPSPAVNSPAGAGTYRRGRTKEGKDGGTGRRLQAMPVRGSRSSARGGGTGGGTGGGSGGGTGVVWQVVAYDPSLSAPAPAARAAATAWDRPKVRTGDE